jgi:hypothetical protein
MKKIVILLGLLIAVFGSFGAFAAEKPVMVIRFNQEYVDYQKSLTKVVNSALAAKPDVLFDVVAVVPEAGSKSDNAKMQARASQLAAKLVGNLNAAGVKPEQIRTTYQNSAVADSEIHIFVR